MLPRQISPVKFVRMKRAREFIETEASKDELKELKVLVKDRIDSMHASEIAALSEKALAEWAQTDQTWETYREDIKRWWTGIDSLKRCYNRGDECYAKMTGREIGRDGYVFLLDPTITICAYDFDYIVDPERPAQMYEFKRFSK
jgi:hypothetical protein